MTAHLTAKYDTLCWGLYSEAKQVLANRRNLGWFTLSYRDDVRIMVAQSHIYEPVQPALDVLSEVLTHTLDRSVSRLVWHPNWRPTKEANSRFFFIGETDSSNYAEVMAKIEQIYKDGYYGKDSEEVVKARLDQSINGVSFDSRNSQ